MTNEGYNPVVIPVVPSLEYDSYITIGVDDGQRPQQQTVNSRSNRGGRWPTWGTSFEQGNDLSSTLRLAELGLPLNIYAMVYAGEDSLVLIGQFTTDATTGQITFQAFGEGQL